ncbi:carotenoid biosynthesis protein [Arcanobacterium phocisimile]|uniref:Carotenoid biosynthesis protein n=1 Tax=Arcanobacterium phocisimile TaxID=1302235 RepID=A0ABX7IFE7_9ACTO|nr:carotenoid biosynthesis protein [Arcanobacterium phocisimile]QRV01762.1 carotenoid biosynthesis protein [Arcanobacterium phocisimile]
MPLVVAALAVVTLAFMTWYAVKVLGWKPALAMIGSGLAIAYVLEEIGVHTGLIFGRYYFTALMGPKLDVIPIAVFSGWVTLLYIAWVITNLLIDGSPIPTRHTPGLIVLRAVVGALVVTTFDLNYDPIAVENGWWVWLDGGSYFGVPVHNYVGWFFVAFVSYLVHGYQLRRKQVLSLEVASKGVRRLSIVPVVLYGISGLTFILVNSGGQLGLISFYVFGIPFLVAAWKWGVWYKNLSTTTRLSAGSR